MLVRHTTLLRGGPAARPSSVRQIKTAPPCKGRRIVVLAHSPTTETKTKEIKFRGFVNEMRKVAMKLHTREQAPKEGEKKVDEKHETSVNTWSPSRQGYLQFLAESKAVYEAFERIMADGKHPEFATFVNTGLERSAALNKDLKWFEETYGLKPEPLKEDGPGVTYVKLIEEEADKDAPAFICHYYNFYFAHTAGGRMIGSKVAGAVLDNKELEFYKWDGDVKELLDQVREKINKLAEQWSPEQKDHCLKETEASFKYSGLLMRCIFQ